MWLVATTTTPSETANSVLLVRTETQTQQQKNTPNQKVEQDLLVLSMVVVRLVRMAMLNTVMVVVVVPPTSNVSVWHDIQH